MEAPQSAHVTQWLRQLEKGDSTAFGKLWECYFQQIHRVVNRKVRDVPQGVLDSEEIVMSVFESLWRSANEGRMQTVANRDELSGMLLTFVKHKVVDHIRRSLAKFRLPDDPVVSFSNSSGKQILERLTGHEAPVVAEAIMREEYLRALDMLSDDQMREIAVLHLQGLTTREIAVSVDVSDPTVTRKLRCIRGIWQKELRTPDDPE